MQNEPSLLFWVISLQPLSRSALLSAKAPFLFCESLAGRKVEILPRQLLPVLRVWALTTTNAQLQYKGEHYSAEWLDYTPATEKKPFLLSASLLLLPLVAVVLMATVMTVWWETVSLGLLLLSPALWVYFGTLGNVLTTSRCLTTDDASVFKCSKLTPLPCSFLSLDGTECSGEIGIMFHLQEREQHNFIILHTQNQCRAQMTGLQFIPTLPWSLLQWRIESWSQVSEFQNGHKIQQGCTHRSHISKCVM